MERVVCKNLSGFWTYIWLVQTNLRNFFFFNYVFQNFPLTKIRMWYHMSKLGKDQVFLGFPQASPLGNPSEKLFLPMLRHVVYFALYEATIIKNKNMLWGSINVFSKIWFFYKCYKYIRGYPFIIKIIILDTTPPPPSH